jgi:phosphinothricin acetyltransferase
MRVRPATVHDAAAIAAIYNQAVENTTASFDLATQTTEDRLRWLSGRPAHHPVLVAEADGAVVAWGALSSYSPRAAYDATVEISVYVDEAWHRQGIGTAMTRELVAAADDLGVHSIIARICTENGGSLRMTRSLGFRDVGTMREVGRKFDRWLDVAILERVAARVSDTA